MPCGGDFGVDGVIIGAPGIGYCKPSCSGGSLLLDGGDGGVVIGAPVCIFMYVYVLGVIGGVTGVVMGFCRGSTVGGGGGG